jgi:hypothetical protein
MPLFQKLEASQDLSDTRDLLSSPAPDRQVRAQPRSCAPPLSACCRRVIVPNQPQIHLRRAVKRVTHNEQSCSPRLAQ